MQRDSPLGCSGYKSVHVFCLDLFQRVFCFPLGRISPDSYSEWNDVSVHPYLIALFDETRRKFFSVGFVIIGSDLDGIFPSLSRGTDSGGSFLRYRCWFLWGNRDG